MFYSYLLSPCKWAFVTPSLKKPFISSAKTTTKPVRPLPFVKLMIRLHDKSHSKLCTVRLGPQSIQDMCSYFLPKRAIVFVECWSLDRNCAYWLLKTFTLLWKVILKLQKCGAVNSLLKWVRAFSCRQVFAVRNRNSYAVPHLLVVSHKEMSSILLLSLYILTTFLITFWVVSNSLLIISKILIDCMIPPKTSTLEEP